MRKGLTTMEKPSSSKTELTVLRNYFWILLILWTVLVGSTLLWSLLRQRHETLEVAYLQAQSAFGKDVVYRRWAAVHGGVYVPVTEQAPPNPYLSHVEERDIETPSGRKLTLMNPAYMTRQVHEMGAASYGIRGHITSLNPIRSANAADLWETEALKAFEQGAMEVSSVEKIDEEEYMRLMRPLSTEQSCLKCHAEQGYNLGELRGGISVSVPMSPLHAIARGHMATLALGHSLLWLLGITGITIGEQHLKKRMLERDRAEETLLESEQRFRDFFENAPIGFHIFGPDQIIIEINDAELEMIGYSKKTIVGKKTWAELLVPQQRDKFKEHWHSIITKGYVRNLEYTLVHKDGHHIDVILNASARFDKDGNVVNTRGSVLNTTARKQAEEQIRTLSRFPSENPNPILRISAEGVLLYANQSSSKLLVLWEIVEKENVNTEIYDVVADALASGQNKQIDVECAECIFSLTFAPVAKMNYVNVYALDITERKQAQIELQDAHHGLEQKVQERTKELAETVEILHNEVADRKRLEKEVLTISEEEQRRIGRELHDGLQQELVGMTFNCERLKRKLAAKSQPEAEEAAIIHRLLKDSIDHARDITRMLYPIDLESKELTLALKQLTTRVEHLFGISCPFKYNVAISVKNHEKAINIYRIAQ